jgi:hypothetical protein
MLQRCPIALRVCGRQLTTKRASVAAVGRATGEDYSCSNSKRTVPVTRNDTAAGSIVTETDTMASFNSVATTIRQYGSGVIGDGPGVEGDG